jgi:cyanophycin synthetase
MLRGRGPGEVPALLERALLGAGISADRMERCADEEMAARSLLEAALPGDVVVLPIHTRDVRERLHAALAAEGGITPARDNGDSNHILGQ